MISWGETETLYRMTACEEIKALYNYDFIGRNKNIVL